MLFTTSQIRMSFHIVCHVQWHVLSCPTLSCRVMQSVVRRRHVTLIGVSEHPPYCCDNKCAYIHTCMCTYIYVFCYNVCVMPFALQSSRAWIQVSPACCTYATCTYTSCRCIYLISKLVCNCENICTYIYMYIYIYMCTYSRSCMNSSRLMLPEPSVSISFRGKPRRVGEGS